MFKKERFEFVKQGLQLIWTNKTLTNLRQIVRGLLNGIVWFIGLIDAYSILSGLFVLQGVVNLYALLVYPDRRGGLSVLASDTTTQIGIALAMIIMGWVVANFRRLEILSLGSLFWLYYATQMIYATLFLSLSIGATLSAINLVAAVAGLLSATESKIQRARDKAKYEKALADVRTLKMIKGGESGRSELAQDTG